jgi:hypothetical protein
LLPWSGGLHPPSGDCSALAQAGYSLASTNDEFASDGPDDQSYMRGRWADLKVMQDLDQNFELYPHNFPTTTTISEFNTTYQHLGPGERRPETCVTCRSCKHDTKFGEISCFSGAEGRWSQSAGDTR